MIAPFFIPSFNVCIVCNVECARFAQQGLKAISYPGSELPRGYFCLVTPP